jgi:uncharacterized protein YndB with AHSA1/START domain
MANDEFVITRVFAAPRALVFDAWTDAEHLAAWWGPHGFTNRCEADARPGGKYRIVMVGADGVEYAMKGVYREVVRPERLVYSADLSEHPEAWHDLIDPKRDKRAGRPALPSITTVTFEELDGKTRVTVRMRFEDPALLARFVATGMEHGWSSSFERLDAWFTRDRAIYSRRVLNAPCALVWRMFTEREHVAHWWGPRGFTNTISKMEVRPGGEWEFVMHGPDGTDYPNKWVYVELTPPTRLVIDHVSEPRFRSTIVLTEFGGKTAVEWRGVLESVEARDLVVRKHNAAEGLDQNLERLEARVRTLI